jgi:glycosyltransferase involved in cell wall biosynthesis
VDNISVSTQSVTVKLGGRGVVELSAVVCAHNEEARLAACLRSLSFADEVVVVLDRCTDRSRAIAEAHGATIVAGVFPLEGPRRAAGMAAASGRWIFELDADEQVTPELACELKEAILDERWTVRRVRVDNYVGGRLIRYGWGGSYGTTLVARLYRKGVKRWGGERVHPGVRFDGAEGPRLEGAIIHRMGDGVSDMLRRLDRYTELRAADLREHGGKTGKLDNALRGVRRFWKCYVGRSGWREGGWGLFISLMAALYPFLSALRAELEAPAAAPALEAEVVLPVAA